MKRHILIFASCILACAGKTSHASVDYHGDEINQYNFTANEYNAFDFSNSNFSEVTAVDTLFSSSSVVRNYSYSNFSESDLQDSRFNYANLTNATFEKAGLKGVYFISATLSGTNFTDANIEHADFTDTTKNGFTSAQLYSTASYIQGNLQYLGLQNNTMIDWNFSGIDLTRVEFEFSTLTNSDFRNSIVTNAALVYADISGADFRGSTGLSYSACKTENTIFADGTLYGGSLNLSGSSSSFIIRPSDTSAIKVTASGSVSDGALLVYRDVSSASENAKLSVSGESVELDLSQANIDVVLAEDFSPLDPSYIVLAESSDGGSIVADGLTNGSVRVFNSDGSPFAGTWNLVISENEIGLNVSIPEPAGWIAISLSALLCALLSSRRKL